MSDAPARLGTPTRLQQHTFKQASERASKAKEPEQSKPKQKSSSARSPGSSRYSPIPPDPDSRPKPHHVRSFATRGAHRTATASSHFSRVPHLGPLSPPATTSKINPLLSTPNTLPLDNPQQTAKMPSGQGGMFLLSLSPFDVTARSVRFAAVVAAAAAALTPPAAARTHEGEERNEAAQPDRATD